MGNRILIEAARDKGGYAEVGRQLGVSRQAVYKWLNLTRVPATRAMDIARVLGVDVVIVRPDVFSRGKEWGR